MGKHSGENPEEDKSEAMIRDLLNVDPKWFANPREADD